MTAVAKKLYPHRLMKGRSRRSQYDQVNVLTVFRLFWTAHGSSIGRAGIVWYGTVRKP
jgi:hypothetical protein